MGTLNFNWASSLEKIFLTPSRQLPAYTSATALQGETFSVQLVYRTEYPLEPMQIKVISPLADMIEVRQVHSTPAEYFGEKMDDYILDNRPGLYPDLLSKTTQYRSASGVAHALWLTIRLSENTAAGTYPIQLQFTHSNYYRPHRDFQQLSPVFELNVLPCKLPQVRCKVTEWFYCDCLCSYYKLEPWSDEFFRILKNYFLNMRAHAINMIYVPLFTVPLDTHVGYERPTFQSVQVFESADGNWSFDFSLLERYLKLAEECGMDYFEFSHLFTQWGAKFTPKIMVTMPDGTQIRRFGWDVPADSELYQRFLSVLLPQLKTLLEKHNWQKKSYFHISDEPYEDHLENYKKASELFHKNLQGYKFIDALSRPDFYLKGLVDIPVPANNHIQAFTDLELPERWVYYCVSQFDKVPNQFTHLPSARNRILGLLMYVYDLEGFLHWGFNFWFGQLSTFTIDPYRDTCAGRGFPPGDAFKVYPGADGKPEDSIRHEVFFDAMQDLAALQTLEQKRSREEVLELIRQCCGGQLPTMMNYPHGAEFLLDFREKVNRMLAED